MKLEAWLDEWLTDCIRPSAKGKTCTEYARIIENHLKPKLGHYELEQLTPALLQRFVTDLLQRGNLHTGKGLSANSVNTIITILQNSLKAADNLGVVHGYTADRIKRPKIKEKEVSCFTLSEQKIIEQAVLASKKPKLFGILLCLYTGLRIGELLALQWSDIDFRKGTITVSRTSRDGYDETGTFCQLFDTPKTESSKRVIPLPRQILPLLRAHKNATHSRYVISDDGRQMCVRSYQRSFELLLKRLGIKRKGFHALRHTFATRALECGMDIKTLSEILGHKNATVTLGRYVHSLMEHKKEMMNKLGKML